MNVQRKYVSEKRRKGFLTEADKRQVGGVAAAAEVLDPNDELETIEKIVSNGRKVITAGGPAAFLQQQLEIMEK